MAISPAYDTNYVNCRILPYLAMYDVPTSQLGKCFDSLRNYVKGYYYPGFMLSPILRTKNWNTSFGDNNLLVDLKSPGMLITDDVS